MKKINIKKAVMALMLLFVFALPVNAQTGFDDDVDDAPDQPQAPIDNYIPIAFAGALAIGYAVIGKRKNLA